MKPKIALFVHQPKCSIQSCNGIIDALSDHYNFKIFTKHEIEDDFFSDVDAVCFPGGIGDSDSFNSLFKHNITRVRDYVQGGGRYLGICMGAYWADSCYFSVVGDLDVVQYIKRPTAETRRPHAKAMPILWKGNPHKMFFYDGCTFVGDGKYDTIATYPNGDPMAIIQDRIGLIGCHPESGKFWYDSYSWMGKHWHGNSQHQLLLDFVDDLMQR